MKRRATSRAAAAFFVAALAAGGAQAQQGSWRLSASITPVYLGSADLDGGGDFSTFSTIVRAGVLGSIGGANLAGVTFNYERSDYSFSRPAAFGGTAPWNVVKRYGVSVPLVFGFGDRWVLGAIPSLDWSRENGADEGESLTWGGVLSATRFFDGGNAVSDYVDFARFLAGPAFSGAVASFSPETVDFKRVVVGAASAPRTVTVSNAGNLPLELLVELLA